MKRNVVKLKGDGKHQDFMTLGKFRLCTVARLVFMHNEDGSTKKDEKGFPAIDFETIPPHEELAIEVNVNHGTKKKPSYIVIAFVEHDKDGECSYRSVGDRIEKECPDWESTRQFRKVLAEAFEVLYANYVKHKEESHEW